MFLLNIVTIILMTLVIMEKSYNFTEYNILNNLPSFSLTEVFQNVPKEECTLSYLKLLLCCSYGSRIQKGRNIVCSNFRFIVVSE